jgi:hypothetical protein
MLHIFICFLSGQSGSTQERKQPRRTTMSNREAFEKWVCQQSQFNPHPKEFYLNLNGLGEYASIKVQGAWEGWQAALQHAPQPAVTEWVGGHPPIETMAIMHIPTRGYPDYMVIGYMDEEGWIMDSSGDDAGYNADDVVRWMPAPTLNSAAKGE